MSSNAWDIVGYTYGSETYCWGGCVIDAMTGHGAPYDGWRLARGARLESVETQLDVIALAFGIDRHDESSYDSGDFPKVIFSSSVGDETCASCGGPLD